MHWKEGRTEGRTEGRKQGRKQGRKETNEQSNGKEKNGGGARMGEGESFEVQGTYNPNYNCTYKPPKSPK